ncbi:MAG: AraC family transcriptional regulator, partial [Planctomycetes bacterium]|nr:AraC family transcriptional regulator [Planctomycetota bacterium]
AGREHTLTPGDFYAAPPGVEHALLNRPTGKHHFLYVGVDVAAALKRQPALAACFTAREFTVIADAEAIEAPLRALIHEIATDAPYRVLGMRAALDHLLIACARLLTSAGERALVPAHPGTARTRHLIDRRPDERWTIAALAREAGLSPSRLCELFVRDVGMPPRQYLLHRRISRAKESLRDTDIAITVLALDLGFSSSQHFARTFRRLVGCTAFAFRRRYRS